MVDGALAVRTGVMSNTENGVVSTVGALDDEVVTGLLDWLDGVPASWIALDPTLGPVLVSAGCRPEEEAWCMVGRIEQLGSPDHDVREVESASDLDEWLATMCVCGWWDDVDAARSLYTKLGFDGLYLAAGGAASAFFAPPVAYLTSLAVLPEARRRGIGRSLALARLGAGRLRGCTSAVLAPTPEGRLLYETLGFHIERQPPGHWFYLASQPAQYA
jgi:ribosomal protein S18 acetylase RimI-like enzyme